MMTKLIIGTLETASLPELGIHNLDVRIDTGAQTSSLHVDNIKRIEENGKRYVQFSIHPDIYHVEDVVVCKARLHDVRKIKSSNGTSQERYVIKTDLSLGKRTWPIEITLSDRSDMTYLMLLGRQGMKNGILVDPSETFLVS